MRILLVALLLATSLAAETPRESFEAFVAAVLDAESPRAERDLKFERYFDFDAWRHERKAAEGKPYTDAERAELKQGWLDLFASDDFRKRYAASGVQVIHEPEPADGKAELLIAIGEQQFRVLMNAAADGTHWRWYSIPAVEAASTPQARLEEIERLLKQLELEAARVAAAAEALRDEAARIRSDLAEENAGESRYASPKSVVSAAWAAVEAGDVNELLDCHTAARVADADAEDVKRSMSATLARLMSWEVLDSVIDEQDPDRAVVRVRLKLQRVGDTDERTLSVNVVRRGGQWKIDEAP